MSVSKIYSKSLVFFIAVLIITGVLVYWFRWNGSEGNDWKSIIDGDGKGYYAYFEQIVFKKNFGRATPDYDHLIKTDDRSLIKYQCGTALLISPFFLSAALVNGFPDDPYAEAYQKSVSVAALFYLLLGCIFLCLLLCRLKIKPGNIFISLAAAIFATNLLVYSVLQPDMSHVYSFAMISGFLWTAYGYIHDPKFKYLLFSAITLGIVYLIRPVNILIIFFVLFFFDDFKSVRIFIKQHIKRLLLFGAFVLLVMAIQSVLWYIQCGHFFVRAYQDEGFYWLHPEFFKVLFSFRKGLFVYTPVLLIVFLSLAVLFKTNKFRFFTTLFFLFFHTYIVAAWWCWTYFDSFGMRPFVDFYGVFVLLFALLLNNLKKSLRIIVLIFCIPLLLLNIIQSYQYQKNILSPEYMNFESYQYIFLKTSDEYVGCVGGSYDLVSYNKFEKKLIFSASPDSKNGGIMLLDQKNEYGGSVRISNDLELFGAIHSYAEITFKKWDYRVNGSSNALFVVSLSYKGRENAFYKAFPINYLPGSPENRWKEYSYSMILPKILDPEYELTLYIWNSELEEFKIKDLEIHIFKTA